jgi:hypothetical protein
MKRLFLILIIILSSYSLVFTQTNKPCPTIGVVGPSGTIQPGDPVTFSVSLSNEAENLKLEYKWRVSKGEIIEGQGTASIKIASARVSQQAITATIEITGLPENCPNVSSETLALYACFMPREYKIESFSDEKTSLEELISILSNDRDIVTIFYLEFTNPALEQINFRIQRVLNYLASSKASYKDRITFIAMKSEQDLNRIIYQFRDDEPLICTNCQDIKIIKGSDFDLKKP